MILAILALLALPRPPAGPGGQGDLGTAAPDVTIPRGDARFLVVGLTQDLHRTDTIIVVQWDDARSEARVLSIPRDIGIVLPGIGMTKIVHAFATGGIGRARAAVVRLLDVPIAHYVVFSLPGMRHIVDLIGGVPITVEKRMRYTDREQGLFIDLQPGPQTLNGARAEQYLRFRNDREGDIGRIGRQQHFLFAAMAAVHRPAVWIRLPVIVGTAKREIDTDLTKSQILGWVRRVEHVSPDEVSAYSIEGRPLVRWDALVKARLDFWVPDPDDLRAKVRWLVTGVLPPTPKP